MIKFKKLIKFTSKDKETIIDPIKCAIPRQNTIETIVQVNALVRKGYMMEEVALELGISVRTAWRRYYGFMDCHYLTNKESMMEEIQNNQYYIKSDGEYIYPRGYIRMHLGARCVISK